MCNASAMKNISKEIKLTKNMEQIQLAIQSKSA